MDLAQIPFIGLMTIGFVNGLTFFVPDMDSKTKFAASIVAAFVLSFIPAEIANILLEKVKLALQAALLASGGYKISQVIGGK